MYLYEVYMNNGLHFPDEEHFTELVVAENEDDVLNKVKNKNVSYFTDYDCCWWDIKKVEELDGYKVNVKNKENDEYNCIKVIYDESKLKDILFQCILSGYRDLKLEKLDKNGEWLIKCRY